MNQVPIISFPEDSTLRSRKPKTLIYLIKLLYGSGLLLSVVYAVLIFVVSPLLDLQYDRRLEILQLVKKGLRDGIYTKILTRLKTVPNLVVKYGDKYYSDASVQTDSYDEQTEKPSKFVRFEDEISHTVKAVDLNLKLDKLQNTLLKLNVTNYQLADDEIVNDSKVPYQVSEMQPLLFQLKQLQTYCDLCNESIFRKSTAGYDFFQQGSRSGKPSRNLVSELQKDIKEMRKHALKNY